MFKHVSYDIPALCLLLHLESETLMGFPTPRSPPFFLVWALWEPQSNNSVEVSILPYFLREGGPRGGCNGGILKFVS